MTTLTKKYKITFEQGKYKYIDTFFDLDKSYTTVSQYDSQTSTRIQHSFSLRQLFSAGELTSDIDDHHKYFDDGF